MASREDLKASAPDARGDLAYRSGCICLKMWAGIAGSAPHYCPSVFSVVVFDCRRCDYHETRFCFSKSTFIIPIIFAVAGSGGFYLLKTQPWVRGDEGQLNTADALAKARNSSGALSTFELMMLKKPRTTMDNQAILQLVRANVGVPVITQMVRTSNADYDVSPGAVNSAQEGGR